MIKGFIAVFVIMICLPFLIAYGHYKRTQGTPLFINQTRKKDVRYFGHSFRAMLQKARLNKDRKIITIREEEPYLEEADLKDRSGCVDSLVLDLHGPLEVPKAITNIKKEVYGSDSVFFTGGGDITCRAICAEKDIHIEKNLMLERWMDAEETIFIHGDCDLGINTAAGKAIHIEGRSVFRRLYAPRISVGACAPYEAPSFSGDETQADIISEKGVTISDGDCIRGSISSHRFIKIGNNAVVSGNLFADGGIVIGDNAHILGNVFSQENVFLGNGVTIGKEGEIRSVVARGRIHLAAGDQIYGFISCEQEGEIMSRQHA